MKPEYQISLHFDYNANYLMKNQIYQDYKSQYHQSDYSDKIQFQTISQKEIFFVLPTKGIFWYKVSHE